MNTTTRLIPLSQGKSAIVDAVDYDFLIQWKWHVQKMWRSENKCYYYYALRNSRISEGPNRKHIFMHLVIAERAGLNFKEIDHHSRNGLDDRRINLRPCTRSQNCANKIKREGYTSRYKGVSWHKPTRKWRATIGVNYKTIHLGLFVREIDAHRAYKAAAIHYFGEFAAP